MKTTSTIAAMAALPLARLAGRHHGNRTLVRAARNEAPIKGTSDAAKTFWAAGDIQHNPMVADGLHGFATFMGSIPVGGRIVS